MKLYYSPGACSLAPHIVAREVGVALDLVEVNLMERAHLRPEYLAVNPYARVPALEVEGQIYTEVPALLTYLASLKPESGLLPPYGSAEFARCLEWLGWFSSSLHVSWAQYVRPERFLPADADFKTLTAFGLATFERMASELDRRIAGPWLLGSDYSIADPYALPFYRWGHRVGLPMAERHPRWAAWVKRMLKRPALREAIDHEGIGYELFERPNAI